MVPEKCVELLKSNFGDAIRESKINHSNELYIVIPFQKIPEICGYVARQLNIPLVSLFANDERAFSDGNFALYYVFGCREDSLLIILKSYINQANPIFPSITENIQAANLYEREIRDQFGLIPEGHPDPRSLIFHDNWPENVYPLRKDAVMNERPPLVHHETEFPRVSGSGVFEIPVGPVHAGIIEPGHFRFSVAGEPIIHLEAQLYYVHKGIEKLCEGQTIEKCLFFAERISGDETFSNSLAYCQAIERIAGTSLSPRAEYSRVVLAELERLVSHLGDLSGVCVDVAYGFAASQFRMLRIWTYQVIEEVCGSRFLRSVNRPGGLRRDFLAGKEKKLLADLAKIEKELEVTVKIVKANSLFIDRVEHTGILPHEVALDLNAVGPTGRAAGIRHDVRKDRPYAAYGKLNFEIPDHNNGDVNCRLNVKLEECFTTIAIIRQAIGALPGGDVFAPLATVEPYQYALGYTESPRGENIHWIMTGPSNTIFRYKIRTPSFCNWPALCYAVNGNIVPDFPLINKSFNLSYAGNDL